MAGALLILTALATAVAVGGRVAADADQQTIAQSLDRIALNGGLYGFGGAARLISGVALIAGAWLLMNTWIVRERLGTPLVPALFAVSGLFTAVSGGCALALAVSAPDSSDAAALAQAATDPLNETIYNIRWMSGKIGFAAAGLALLVAARYQWKVGGTLKYIAPVSALIGLGMQLIWVDSATVAHRITGPAFFVWLLAIGTMLASGQVERHFVSMVSVLEAETSESRT